MKTADGETLDPRSYAGQSNRAQENARLAGGSKANRGLSLGSVIHLRNRVWRVDRVDEQEFWATPLGGRDTRPRRISRATVEGWRRPGGGLMEAEFGIETEAPS